MNKYTIIGITIFLILAFASTQPIREDQSCLSQYQSWYYSGQQCMQCYNYFQENVETCNKCSGDQCSGCDGTTVLVKEKMLKMNQQGKFVDVELSYCRQCFNIDKNNNDEKIENYVEECCFMDQKEKIQLNTENIDQNDSEFGTYTYGYGSYKSTGYHATKCTPQDNGQDIKLYGSVCYTIENCQKIGDYGHCMQCLDGYYLTEKLSCTQCDNHDWYSTGNSELKSATVNKVGSTGSNTGGFCKKCNGPAQCSECGLNSAMTKGSFLLTNQGREFYDLNIAKNPSFCRECNDNCLCTDSTELCKTCIDGTATTPGTEGAYYYDPHQQKCIHCSILNNLCNKCMWVTELDKAICVGCQARTDEDSTSEFENFKDELKVFNGDDSFNVLQFPQTYYLRIEDDHKIKEVSDNQVKCIPCFEVYDGTHGTKKEIIWVNETDDFKYKINDLDLTETNIFKTDSTDSSKIMFFRDSVTDATGSETTTNMIKGCANCQLQSISGSYTTQEDDEPTKKDILHYVTCNQCHNGFAEVVYNNFGLTVQRNNDSTKFIKFNIQNYQECHTCQYLINLHDQLLEKHKLVDDEIKVNHQKRSQLVSRCNRKAIDQQNKSYFNYEITQCSSKPVDDYFTETSDFTKSDRGTGYFGKAGMVETTRADITNYFLQGENQLGIFRVNLEGTIYKRMKNMCVDNKNKCKTILDITQETSSVKRKDKTDTKYSPLNNPRCSLCFDNYVLTEDYTCVECKHKYGEKSDDISVGCKSCVKKQSKDNEDLSNKIVCSDCYNNVQPLKQVKQGLRSKVDYNKDIDRKNYYSKEGDQQDQKTCFECNVGCLECQNEDKKCEKAQNYWRIADNYGKDNTTFERCTVDYCLNCDNGKDVCLRCEAGYAVIKLNSDEDNKFIYRCEKCEIGCLKCESDVYDNATSSQYQESTYNRKNCSACEIGYYLEKNNDRGICKPARDNCINWLSEGGACLQCAFGYRLQDGWCYKCIDSYSGLLGNGYWDCPSQCDSETGITSSSSNVRNAAALKANAELSASKNPVEEPEKPEETTPETTSRILQLLDEFQPSN